MTKERREKNNETDEMIWTTHTVPSFPSWPPTEAQQVAVSELALLQPQS
jgi:hypothetical protein